MDGAARPTGTRLLIAEDDADLLAMAALILDQGHYEVLQASDGAQALEVAHRAGPIDVLFTDVVMPEADGLEVATALADQHPDLRVVFTTAFASPGLVDAVADLGCELLLKPYAAGDLRRAVAEARTIDTTDAGSRAAP